MPDPILQGLAGDPVMGGLGVGSPAMVVPVSTDLTTRAGMLNLLSTRYGAVTADLNIPETAAISLGYAVDMALRELGIDESAFGTVSIKLSLLRDFLALADYYTLEELLRHVPTFADITAYQPAIQKMRSQIFAQLRLLRDDAAQRVALLGYSAVATNGVSNWQLDQVELDYLEPNTEGW